MNAAPKCQLHVGMEMQLVELGVPGWILSITDESFSANERAKRKRLVWKCPVAGCHRVAAYSPTDEELAAAADAIPCPRCGKPSDATTQARWHSQFICAACQKKMRVSVAQRSAAWRLAQHKKMGTHPRVRRVRFDGPLDRAQRASEEATC